MWICTGFGMFMPVLRAPELFNEGDDPAQTIQIRARRRKELTMLRKLYMPELGKTVATPNRDYQFRAYCTPEVASAGFAKAIAEINYEHFKETTETVYSDKLLHDVYMRIWGAACELNPPNWEKNYKHTKASRIFADLDSKKITKSVAFTRLAKLPRKEWEGIARDDERLAIEALLSGKPVVISEVNSLELLTVEELVDMAKEIA